jgi:GTPase KRas protein
VNSKSLMVDGESTFLEVMDTAGDNVSELWKVWIKDKAKGVIVVYSITSRASFEQVSHIIDQIIHSKNPAALPLIVVGNKTDLSHGRTVSTLEGRELARKYGAKFFETSAKNNSEVTECFVEMVRTIREVEYMYEPPVCTRRPHHPLWFRICCCCCLSS